MRGTLVGETTFDGDHQPQLWLGRCQCAAKPSKRSALYRPATAGCPGFYRTFVIVVSLIVLYLVVAVLRVYLDQTLQLRWRRWLTDQYITRWLADRTFYRMRFSGRVDNPDQRISEDVRLFIERSMVLGLGFLNSLATLASFAALLWYLSGSITLPIGGFEVTIPGYLFWLAVLYSGPWFGHRSSDRSAVDSPQQPSTGRRS